MLLDTFGAKAARAERAVRNSYILMWRTFSSGVQNPPADDTLQKAPYPDTLASEKIPRQKGAERMGAVI